MILANVLANITRETFAAPGDGLSVSYAWLGAICYALQLFFDFSGYSDMAIGISRMFGYRCPENFNYPYMTASVSEFWRRWHMTLGAWFRDYVYIPLGGSRVSSRARLYLNLFVVWILTGLWHGANWNFIVWGLGYFALIAFEKTTGWPDRLQHKRTKIIYRFFTLFFIILQWVMFRADGFLAGITYIRHMFWAPANHLAKARAAFLLQDNFVFIAAAVILCVPVVPWLRKKCEKKKNGGAAFSAVMTAVCLLLFLWAVSFVVAGQNNPFLYANF